MLEANLAVVVVAAAAVVLGVSYCLGCVMVYVLLYLDLTSCAVFLLLIPIANCYYLYRYYISLSSRQLVHQHGLFVSRDGMRGSLAEQTDNYLQ